jgi:hypothetical protein
MQTPVTYTVKGSKSERLCGMAFLALKAVWPLLSWTVSAQITVKFIVRPTVSQSVCLCDRHQSGAHDKTFVIMRKLRFVDVGHLLSWKDGSIIFNCCWTLPVQSFSDPNPAGFRFDLPQPGWSGALIHIPQDQDGHSVLFVKPLERYCNLPPLEVLSLTQLCSDSPDVASVHAYREHRFSQLLCDVAIRVDT